MLLLLPFSFLCYCRSFKTKQNLIASLVNEADQNWNWTTAEQFRSNLCQFVPSFWGAGGGNEGGYPSVDWLGSCPISPNEEAMFGPILANNFSVP